MTRAGAVLAIWTLALPAPSGRQALGVLQQRRGYLSILARGAGDNRSDGGARNSGGRGVNRVGLGVKLGVVLIGSSGRGSRWPLPVSGPGGLV